MVFNQNRSQVFISKCGPSAMPSSPRSSSSSRSKSSRKCLKTLLSLECLIWLFYVCPIPNQGLSVFFVYTLNFPVLNLNVFEMQNILITTKKLVLIYQMVNRIKPAKETIIKDRRPWGFKMIDVILVGKVVWGWNAGRGPSQHFRKIE